MAQITEDYVPYDIAKLLKEKRFDAECKKYYNLKMLTNLYYGCEYVRNRDLKDEDDCIAPSLGMTMKWLREVHNCHIYVQAFITTDGLQGYCPFYTKVGDIFIWQNVLGDDYATAPTYEEAAEAAIKYCLENLI